MIKSFENDGLNESSQTEDIVSLSIWPVGVSSVGPLGHLKLDSLLLHMERGKRKSINNVYRPKFKPVPSASLDSVYVEIALNGSNNNRANKRVNFQRPGSRQSLIGRNFSIREESSWREKQFIYYHWK